MSWRLWFLGSIACFGALTVGYWYGVRAGRAEVEAAWSRQRVVDAQVVARLRAQAHENERGLQAAAERIRRERDEEMHRLVRDHNAAVERLRKRADRPADYVPAAAETAGAGPAPGCGADQLYRQDAATALGIARDADIVRVALNQCHQQYDAAVRALSPEDPTR